MKIPSNIMFEGIFILAHWLIDDVDGFAAPDPLALFQKELPRLIKPTKQA
ncbi:hypothetical protein [Shewanella psychrotolerans]|nr:hypothetical protein [Shewanella psychrotolerans]QYK00151.1 hypothetical protein K0I62_11965 [Shewanella psychrotolerans]